MIKTHLTYLKLGNGKKQKIIRKIWLFLVRDFVNSKQQHLDSYIQASRII